MLGFSALKAGMVMAPAMVLSASVSPLAGRMSDRIGGKYILMTGLTLFAVGLAWLARVTDVGRTWWDFQPALIVSGLGIGCVFGPMITVAMHNIEPGMAGAASGVLNTIRQIGTIIGSAAVGAVLQNRLAVSLRDEAAKRSVALPPDVRDHFVAGFDNTANSGLDIGTGQSGAALDPPAGTPTSVVHHMQQVAASTFEHGFVDAMRPTLALPIAAIALGALACALVRRRPHPSSPARLRESARTTRAAFRRSRGKPTTPAGRLRVAPFRLRTRVRTEPRFRRRSSCCRK
ncbi:MFS transporter [Streptomyces sp. SID3343]|uniref:MFS transporter n=1 Tax=Streptomyces sp. SID3343 TaxID=2690260 RepID=UPI001369760C